MFFNAKAAWHPEMERLTTGTRDKQRQVVFKMMREAELLTNDNLIVPALLTPRVVDVIAQDSVEHLSIFPISPHDLERDGA